MTPIRMLLCATTLVGLAACEATPDLGALDLGALDLGALGEPQVTRTRQVAPPGAAPGTCWGKNTTPAIIETVTNQVLLQPAEVMSDGTIARPATYKTETRQEIVRQRHEFWFQTPCPRVMTDEFITSVQRALAARGLYRAKPNGKMDARTRAAVRRFQKPEGLDSGILSLAAARKLGLVAVEIDKKG